jgi:hypothetical protein
VFVPVIEDGQSSDLEILRSQTTNMGATIALQAAFDYRRQQPIGSTHPFPVVLKRPSASQAYLIIAAVIAAARPGEPVCAASCQQIL